jgi:putative ABC transport system permease protein
VIYKPIPADENLHSWDAFGYYLYVRLDAAENVTGLLESFRTHMETTPFIKNFSSEVKAADLSNFFRIVALPELHYEADINYDVIPKANPRTILILSAIALLVILIGGINFINFSLALTPKRIKSINLQKVLGGSDGMIRLALITESVAVCLCSWVIALLLVHAAQYTPVADLVGADIALAAHLPIVAVTALIATLAGLFVGVYPAYYMTSFPPALTLRAVSDCRPGDAGSGTC